MNLIQAMLLDEGRKDEVKAFKGRKHSSHLFSQA
jgi:hypothetical protein